MVTRRFGIIFDYCVDKKLENYAQLEDIVNNSIVDTFDEDDELEDFGIKVSLIRKLEDFPSTPFYNKQTNSFSSLTMEPLKKRLASFGFDDASLKYYLTFTIKDAKADAIPTLAKKTALGIYFALSGPDYILNMLMLSVTKNGWGRDIYQIKPDKSECVDQFYRMLNAIFIQGKKR